MQEHFKQIIIIDGTPIIQGDDESAKQWRDRLTYWIENAPTKREIEVDGNDLVFFVSYN